MKKKLTHLTGIVFLIAVLAAGGCSKGKTPIGLAKEEIIKDSTKVTIYLKAIEIGGEKHLKMYDSNKRDDKVVDTLETLVWPGTKITWKRTWFSGIKKIEKISPKIKGEIINKDAENIPDTKKFWLKIPDNAPIPSQREKYDIVFTVKGDTNSWPIDPYLKIPTK